MGAFVRIFHLYNAMVVIVTLDKHAYLMALWLTIGVRDMYCTNTHSHLIVRDYQSVCHSGSYNCNSAHEPRFYLGAYVWSESMRF